MRTSIVVCIMLAAASLFLPSQPSYDPWAWLVWGRELVTSGTGFDTSGGPSWKPLPVVLAAAVAPLDKLHAGLAPALWLVIVRAAGLMALVLAFRIAARLTGSGARGAAAGAVAAAALALSPGWLRYLAHGNEGPLAVALLLAAVDRHLHGSRSAALTFGVLLCLLRPEAFLFVALYGAWLWRVVPGLRAPLTLSVTAVVALWTVPEWIGSGDPLGGGRQAASAPAWSLAAGERPWLAALERVHRMAGPLLEAGMLAAIALALIRRDRPSLALGGGAIGWLVLVVGMTQAGFSGDERYFTPALALGCVLAGTAAPGLVCSLRPRLARLAAAGILGLLAAPSVAQDGHDLIRSGHKVEALAALHRDLDRAVRRIGGPTRARRAGTPRVNRVFETHLAWTLRLPMSEVESARGQLAFAAQGPAAGPYLRPRARLRPLARAGGWSVLGP